MQSIRFFFCLFLKALWLPSIREKAVNQHKYIYVFILTFESKYIYDIHFTMAYLTNFFFPYLCLMSIDLCYLTCNHWTGCTINNVLVGMLLPYYAFRNNQADQSGSLAFHSSPALNFLCFLVFSSLEITWSNKMIFAGILLRKTEILPSSLRSCLIMWMPN